MTHFQIGSRVVGASHPCLIVAEAGVNHNGRTDLACQMIEEAAAAGVDAVKFQTFRADELVTSDAPKARYQLQLTDPGESQYEMLRKLELTADAHRDLMDCCRKHGVLFMSTPFDEESADLLTDLDIAVFKVASGEITNLRFLAHVARKGKPMILSTGMCDLGEVETAAQVIEETGNQQLALLHCVSSYPADASDVNLRAMQTMAEVFRVPVGFSDHTVGLEVPLAAVALGACIIEKHFTLDRRLPGPDKAFSLEPNELAALVRGARTVEASLGDGRKKRAPSEVGMAAVARRSVVAARDMEVGTRLTEDCLALKRPGDGLAPAMRPYLIGRVLRVELRAGSRIELQMLE